MSSRPILIRRPRRRLSAGIVCALALALLAACGSRDYSTSQTSNQASSNTPTGTRQPRTALPMPPVATAHGSSSETTPAGGTETV
ncbi:MAG TPA: hypothetical protein VJT82_05755, partial [Pyrinomonadaceae bacterium]|nr:hypothetical protein [Pyrinomonadaceae bacterium]